MITLNFETVTPLHISNGEELGYGLDYVIRNDAFYRIDFLRLSEILAKKNGIDFSYNYRIDEIIKVVKKSENLLERDDYLYVVNIRKDFYELTKNPRAEGQKFVKEFINSNGKFYVPSSSVKGAILTILNIESLGIKAGPDADISHKFVFRDSCLIPPENFMVYLTTNRPPKTSLICLRPGVNFSMQIMSKGRLDLSELRSKLISYKDKQINKAKVNIEKFKSKNEIPKGADLFYDALEAVSKIALDKDEYLINIGFGGGSWFKIDEGRIPKFKSKSPRRRGQLEEAHTSVSFKINNEFTHIGWCKLKITEE